jgi:hypothetical protein
MDGSGGTRCGVDGLSFHRIYAKTLPSPWTLSGGIALPTSPTRGVDRAFSATRSTWAPSPPEEEEVAIPMEEYQQPDLSDKETIRRAIEESELIELGH